MNEAAKNFEKNPQHWTYTVGEIEEGVLFALKMGIDADCVVVFRIAAEDVELYTHVIKVED